MTNKEEIKKLRMGKFIPNEIFDGDEIYEEIPKTEEEKVREIGKHYCDICKEKKDCIRKWIDDPIDGGEPFWVSTCKEYGHPIEGIIVMHK